MHALVDAFVKGRAAHKRGTEEYFEGKGLKVKSCAVGAIYYGLYGKIPDGPPSVIPTTIAGDWPQFRNFMTLIPCEHREIATYEGEFSKAEFDGDKGNIAGILIHLNDFHFADWKDKKIQEWLSKTLEDYDRNQTLPQV